VGGRRTVPGRATCAMDREFATLDCGDTAPQLHPGPTGVPPHLIWIFDSEPRSENCLVLGILGPPESVDRGSR
jgi:hypothetical protein